MPFSDRERNFGSLSFPTRVHRFHSSFGLRGFPGSILSFLNPRLICSLHLRNQIAVVFFLAPTIQFFERRRTRNRRFDRLMSVVRVVAGGLQPPIDALIAKVV